MEPSANPLHRLADVRGLARHWRDADGREHVVSDERLEAVLAALGEPAPDDALPALLTADPGGHVALPSEATRAEATGEDGRTVPLTVAGNRLTAPEAPGYYEVALGASRSEIFKQCLVEAGTVGLGGGALGLLLALLGLWAVRQQPVGYADLAHLDPAMFVTTFALAIVASVLAGLVPAWHACQVTPAVQLKSQ